jgi:hypothetical protein
MLLLVAISNVQAQSHTFATGWCKLAKSGGVKGESARLECQACNAKDKKEQTAKLAEDTRRAKVISDKYKADKVASENARLEKLRLEQAKAKRIKDKEIADKIASDAMMKKYKEIAEKGTVKSNAKGTVTTTDFSLNKIEPFFDKARKIYGFKIDNAEVLTLPIEGRDGSIDRLEGTGYFILNVYAQDPDPRYYSSDVYSHSFIINYLGEKMKIKGTTKFDQRIYPNNDLKTIELFTTISTDEYDYRPARGNSGLGNFHQSKESAIADIKSNQRAGWDMHCNAKIYYETRYIVDFNLNLLEESKGYTIRCSN